MTVKQFSFKIAEKSGSAGCDKVDLSAYKSEDYLVAKTRFRNGGCMHCEPFMLCYMAEGRPSTFRFPCCTWWMNINQVH